MYIQIVVGVLNDREALGAGEMKLFRRWAQHTEGGSGLKELETGERRKGIWIYDVLIATHCKRLLRTCHLWVAATTDKTDNDPNARPFEVLPEPAQEALSRATVGSCWSRAVLR